MFNKPLDQKVGDGAVAIQATGSADGVTVNQTNNYGVAVEQIRSVAQDAFRADFVQLLGQAGDIAEARANRVVERFLERLQSENPAGLNQANDPDFRYALLTAQKAQARSGDEDLEALLVGLLIDRSREHQRNLQQIVLNEALEVASRLTDEQVATLTISFIIRRTVNHGALDFNEFLSVMDRQVQPYVAKAKLSDASFSHLAFTGCGVIEMGEVVLGSAFAQGYPGLWQRGFSADDSIYQQLSPRARSLIRPSQNTPGSLEVLAGPEESSKNIWAQLVPDEAERSLIEQLLKRGSLNNDEIKARCVAARPYMVDLFHLWDETSMKKFIPSSVGIAIAHANIIRAIPNFGALSIWIN